MHDKALVKGEAEIFRTKVMGVFFLHVFSFSHKA